MQMVVVFNTNQYNGKKKTNNINIASFKCCKSHPIHDIEFKCFSLVKYFKSLQCFLDHLSVEQTEKINTHGNWFAKTKFSLI